MSGRLIELGYIMGQTTTKLIEHYHGLGVPVFHYTIKLHYTQHAMLVSQYSSPWLWECSSGEDFMKDGKRMIRGCMRGNPIHKPPNVLILKYVKSLHIELDPLSPWWNIAGWTAGGFATSFPQFCKQACNHTCASSCHSCVWSRCQVLCACTCASSRCHVLYIYMESECACIDYFTRIASSAMSHLYIGLDAGPRLWQ